MIITLFTSGHVIKTSVTCSHLRHEKTTTINLFLILVYLIVKSLYYIDVELEKINEMEAKAEAAEEA